MSTIKKQANVRRASHRKDVQRKHRVNVRTKQENRDRTTTAPGLFVAYIKERRFLRTDGGKYVKRCDNGDTHTIIMDYIPGKAALLVINEGSGSAGEYGEAAHVIHYAECPLPTKTIEYLARKQEQDARAARYARRPKQERAVPEWKKSLQTAAEEIRDAAVVEEISALLNKE